MKSALNIFCSLLICLFCVNISMAQTTKADKKTAQAAEIKRIVNGKSYLFKANFALPQTGTSIPLTSNYDVKLSNDSLVAFLPYYGRAFSAPINATDGGIKFTTTKFGYTVTEKKNGNIEVYFKPQNLQPRTPSDVTQMILTVSPGGYANLQIICLNRTPITFTGILTEVKPKPAS